MAEDFTVEYQASMLDDDTVVVTAAKSEEWIRDHEAQILRSALENYPNKPQSSVIPTDDSTSQELTLAYLEELADGLPSSVDNTRTANSLIVKKVISDAYVGAAYDAVVRNINTDYTLDYGYYANDDKYAKDLEEVKDQIEFFNRAINLKKLIRDVISTVYLEGNDVLYLRVPNGALPQVDSYPLSIAYPSDYRWNGDPVIEFSIKNLRDKLRKTYKKTRKNKSVYYENLEKEVQANYPVEVYKGYKDNENEIRLDPRYSSCVRYNHMGRKLGVSPLFRCLKSLIVLDNIESADVSDSQARRRKIIFQELDPKLLGNDGTRRGLGEASHAHSQLMAALSTNASVYTGAPFVRDVRFVQPKSQSDDAIHQQQEYSKKLLISLGIGFTDSEATVGATKVSVEQLMRTVNAIGEALEVTIHKFYETWLEDNHLDPMMAPDIKVIDAEQMEMSVRMDLASFVFNTLGGSFETVYKILGLSSGDEKAKRSKENEDGTNDVFYPHPTSYTTSGDQEAGRPVSNQDEDKRDYDQAYTEDVRN